jgi:tetratricopeptide (TPR) repeat protein
VDLRGGKMLFKFNTSMKTKIIILIIACTIGAGIVASEGYKNYMQSKNKQNTSTDKSSLKEKVSDAAAEKAEADKVMAEQKLVNDEIQKKADQKQEDEKKQAEAAKVKALDDKAEQGHIAFNAKKYVEAIAIEDEVIEEDSTSYKAYNVKGIALCYSQNFDEGMKNIDKALTINPNFGYARFNKALAYELFGYYDEAIAWYNKALQVENYIWSYYGIASIYGRRGDVENTVKYLKIAVDMDSSVKSIAAQEHDFNPVKNSQAFQQLLK